MNAVKQCKEFVIQLLEKISPFMNTVCNRSMQYEYYKGIEISDGTFPVSKIGDEVWLHASLVIITLPPLPAGRCRQLLCSLYFPISPNTELRYFYNAPRFKSNPKRVLGIMINDYIQGFAKLNNWKTKNMSNEEFHEHIRIAKNVFTTIEADEILGVT